MSRYNDAARGAPEPEVDTGGCYANGCPLPGAISESTKGGGPWFCRHHFATAPSRWSEITTRLRRAAANGELLDETPAASPTVQRIREENSRAPAHFTEPA